MKSKNKCPECGVRIKHSSKTCRKHIKRTKEWCERISKGIRKSAMKRGYKHTCEICKKRISEGAKRCIKHHEYVFTKEHRRKISDGLTGKKQSKETLKKLSKIRKGKPAWNRGKKCPQLSGSNNPAWKGGVAKKSHIIRNSYWYEMWRKAIFRRDFYTCMMCLKEGVELNAHHIKSFSEYPEMKFNMDNGITLCKPCHILLHKKCKLDYKLQIKELKKHLGDSMLGSQEALVEN